MEKTSLIIGTAILILLIIGIISSCKTIPKGAVAINAFKSERYLGQWYEIARLDFRFERNLNNTTANYSLNDNGTIKVVNRGYNYKTNQWKEAIGKAKFAGSANEGRLKVSFFGPFYAAYNIIALDADYKYALVVGKNLKYLWILSREKTIPENIKQDYLFRAKNLGYNIDALVWVDHQP